MYRHIYIYIYIYIYIHTVLAHIALACGVLRHGTCICENTLLRVTQQVGTSALKTPSLWLDCSSRCWVAWPRLK